MALTNKLTAIANAIRAKTGKTDPLTLDQMPTEIASISGGGGSSSGDGSPFVIKKVINIGAKVSVTGEKYYTHALYNGVRLPRIPDSVLASYPYAWIRKHTTNDQYQLVLAEYPWYYAKGDMYCSGGNSATEPRYYVTISTAGTATSWAFDKNTTGSFPIDEARPVMWSNHDIPNGSADATDIYFAGSEPVPID